MMFRKHFILLCCLVLMIGLQPSLAQDSDDLHLADNGDYFVGRRSLTFTDDLRPDRNINVEIWYPAVMPDGLSDRQIERFAENGMDDAEPDISAAPYPLVIYSHSGHGQATEGTDPLTILASYGFVGMSIQHFDGGQHIHVDRPLDIIAALDGVAALGEGNLAGLIDTENVGMTGFSRGAVASLQMIGLMIDVDHYESWCAEHTIDTNDCGDMPLEETAQYREELGLVNSEDGGWLPFDDERIRAVMAIAPCFFTLNSEETFAAVTIPVLLTHGVNDSTCDYTGNAARTYTNLPASDSYLITLVTGGHTRVRRGTARMHMMTAFFGYYLQGNEDYAEYLTADFVNSFDDLAWGVYEGE